MRAKRDAAAAAAEVAADANLRAQLAQLRAPVLSERRRRAISAEVMAAADAADASADHGRAPRRRAAIAIGIAAAAAAVMVLATTHLISGIPTRPISPSTAGSTAMGSTTAGSTAMGMGSTGMGSTTMGPTTMGSVETAKTTKRKTIAHKGGRAVFGGSIDQQQAHVDQDMLLSSNPAIVAFQSGWELLRANRYDEAVLAFDRATDPAVAEDAAFWAAVAAQRAGHDANARARFGDFVKRFPESPRIDAAKRALEP